MLTQQVCIQNVKGLHARATSLFVQTAEKFVSQITIKKGDTTVPGTSIIDILMLAAGLGEQIEITADGPDEQLAMQSLVELVNNKFGEGQ